ncbi:hypothetical protein KP509_28G013800 [Ceratopteris richardii]|uniref:Uncharacterized protein n=1 Tax=Ceratopteris richardii TaxID=49495 RepID=A0A8T2R9N1_CERRI|nr:hypothetical protein KP509_28G013800 [Ceratopteris richardii]
MDLNTSVISKDNDSLDAELLSSLEEASLEAGVEFSSSMHPIAFWWIDDSDAFIDYRLKTWLGSAREQIKNPHLMLEHHAQSTQANISTIQRVLGDHESDADNADSLCSKVSQHDSKGMHLKELLKISAESDINSINFTWENLISLHQPENGSINVNNDDVSKGIEITVTSGGVVFFAIFDENLNTNTGVNHSAAVLKFTSSTLTTQSEQLGNELAKHTGVLCPQSRIIYRGSDEWNELQKAVERCLDTASSEVNEEVKAVYAEFIEVLTSSPCVLVMGYVKGHPFLESENAFHTQAVAQNTAAAMARIFLLDLILRNEDRLPCSELGWRGNPANLICTHEIPMGPKSFRKFSSINDHLRASIKHQEISLGEKRFHSVDSFFGLKSADSLGELAKKVDKPMFEGTEAEVNSVFLVTIDSGVPRRPPAGKREMDKVLYPKIVELILNCPDYAGSFLYNISGGKLGFSPTCYPSSIGQDKIDQIKVVKAFQTGFKKGVRDVQDLYIFLMKLYQMLQIFLSRFFQSINAMFPPGNEGMDGSVVQHRFSPNAQRSHESFSNDEAPILQDESTAIELSTLKVKDVSPEQRDSFSGSCNTNHKAIDRQSPTNKSPGLRKQFTHKLRDFNRIAKVDKQLNEELNRWNEILDIEVGSFCEDHDFVSGFLEGGPIHSVIRSYELKVRLEHILERLNLISQGFETERPSQISDLLFIGGAMAAKSLHTLQHLGITHVLCLCPSELKIFQEELNSSICYKEIEVSDQENADIGSKFHEAYGFLTACENSGGKCLVHCFEGRSRSVTIILAYLMTEKYDPNKDAQSHPPFLPASALSLFPLSPTCWLQCNFFGFTSFSALGII